METYKENLIADSQKTISINRTLNLPFDKVWKAWTEEESCKKWWGPKNYTCPHCNIDFKQGGKYLSCMQAPDGKQFWSTGVYQEIIPKSKIVMTDNFADSQGNVVSPSDVGMPGEWPSELEITVRLEEINGKTNLSLQHVGIPEEMYDDCIKGWEESFDKLEANLK